MKIELDTDDLFVSGGDYDEIHLVQKGKPIGILSGSDSFWLIKIRKGTPSHAAVEKGAICNFGNTKPDEPAPPG